MNNPRDRFISEVIKGRTFADVGGLWGTVNEKVSIAHRHGASDLAMIDIAPLDHDLWNDFQMRMQACEVPDVQCISADVLDLAKRKQRPQFDVVHCAGVLYHMLNPMELLTSLHAITLEYLILASNVTATVLENEAGRLEIPSSAAIFVPALQEDEKAIIRADWEPSLGDRAIGLMQGIRWDPHKFGPWWWLPTIECLKSMCRAAGFSVVDEQPWWNGRSHVLLLSK